MAFGWFKKQDGYLEHKDKGAGKKGYLDVPAFMYGAPFSDIIACMDPMYLEDSVAANFENIFFDHNVEDYKYLRLYPSWMKLLAENLETIMISYLHNLKEYKKLIELFPEFSAQIYEFLLDEYIHKDDFDDKDVGKEIDIIDDVLIPMSDLERYQGYYFPIIRQIGVEILDACDTYAEMWDILWALENYFDIPRKQYKEIINSHFEDFVYSYSRHNSAINCEPAIYNLDDFGILNEFIRDQKAYWYFMDCLPRLIIDSGLDLYTILIKLLGPVKEVVDLHDYCAEFISPGYAEILKAML